MNGISPHKVHSMRVLVTVLSTIGLLIALLTLSFCVWLCKKRHEISGMTIIRIILFLQLFEVFKCTFNIIGVYVNISENTGCRVFVFFMLVLAAVPLNLSVGCITYFQMVLDYGTYLQRRAPRIILMSGFILYSIVPEMFVLFIPAHVAGMTSYCDFLFAPSRRLFIFKWLVFYMWATVTCVAGVVSTVLMVIVILRRSYKTRRWLYPLSTSYTHSYNDPFGVLRRSDATVTKESLQRRRNSSIIVTRMLMSMVWFPIVPIVSFGFNTIYSIVWYRTQKESIQVAMIDEVLQFLAVPLFAITFYLNPSVKRALKQYLIDRKDISTVSLSNKLQRPSCRDCSSTIFNEHATRFDSTNNSSNRLSNPIDFGFSGLTTKLDSSPSVCIGINHF